MKNFSLLYSPDLRSLRLAPAYDIVAATVYPMTKELSFRIGNAETIDAVAESDFELAAKEAGIGVRMAMERYHRMVEVFPKALQTAAASLLAEGYSVAETLAEQILQSGGIAYT